MTRLYVFFRDAAGRVIYDRTMDGHTWWLPRYAEERLAILRRRGLEAWAQPTWHAGALV